MIISTCSFGSTGSSTVTDYLSEFDTVQVLDHVEFTWLTCVDGIIDLDYHLNNPINRTADSIYAIDRFKKLVDINERKYKRSGRIDPKLFRRSAEKFIEEITQLKWEWYLPHPKSFFRTYFINAFLKYRIIPRIEVWKGRRISCWPMEEVSFSVKPQNFEQAARSHVRDLLEAMGADFDRPVVLDQLMSATNPQLCFKYLDDPYAIVVDRDPRDIYIFSNTKLIGLQHFMPNQPVEDFVKYYRLLRDNQPYKKPHERVLLLRFEDMVYNYENTTKQIRDFLHLPDNPNPKSVFDPALSMANTQLWKRFPQYQEDIEYIERELPEYLFDFRGCPAPDLNKQMFRGKSPKHK